MEAEGLELKSQFTNSCKSHLSTQLKQYSTGKKWMGESSGSVLTPRVANKMP